MNKTQTIQERRKEHENGEVICIREINENIRNVMEGKPLTRPLSVLNKNCQFKKRYEIAFELENEDRIKEEVKQKKKEYYQRPEVKQKNKEYYQNNKMNKMNSPSCSKEKQ